MTLPTCCGSPSRTRVRCPSRPPRCFARPATASAADSRELVLQDPDNGIEFFFLRPRDIAIYVGSGRLDVGITGEDLLLDSGAKAEVVLPLGFAGSTFRFAAAAGANYTVAGLAGSGSQPRIPACSGTTWPSTASRPRSSRWTAQSKPPCGWTSPMRSPTWSRPAPPCGRPACRSSASRCSTPRLRSSAVAAPSPSPAVEQLIRRLQGVMIARQYVLMDYDIADDLVEKAVAVAPGFESPTVSPLRTPGWSAVRAMVPRRDTNRIMDELWEIGARAILVTDIHACRL